MSVEIAGRQSLGKHVVVRTDTNEGRTIARLNNDGIRIAKANVDRWFVGDENRRFVPLTGSGC